MADIQTQLVKAVKRDILLHRRRVQSALSSHVLRDVHKHRVIDDHMSAKRRAIVNTAVATKRRIDATHELNEGRGHLALDVIYTDLIHALDRLETKITDDLEALKSQNEDILKDLAELEHTMAVRQSSCHFFKGLYERDRARPVGETLEMMRDEQEHHQPMASPWAYVRALFSGGPGGRGAPE